MEISQMRWGQRWGKALLIYPFSMIVSLAFGQETKVKQVDSKDSYEEYSVLLSDKKVKHGRYTLLEKDFFGGISIRMAGNYALGKKEGHWSYFFDNPTNQVKESGEYSNDLKTGLWVTYYPEARIVELRRNLLTNEIEVDDLHGRMHSQEHYAKGHPVGIWSFYSLLQEQVQVYDFDKDSLLLDADVKAMGGNRTHRPLFIGGDERLRELVESSFDFHEIISRVSKMGLKSGVLRIEVNIDDKGSVTHLKELENSFNNNKIIKRAYTAVDSVNEYWLPAYESNLPVRSTRVIKFVINQEVKYPAMNSNDRKIHISVKFRIEIE